LRRFGETEQNSTLYTEDAAAGATLGAPFEILIWPMIRKVANRNAGI
jgi:hypothetical protein